MSESDFTGGNRGNGEGFSTTDEHGFTQIGGGFSTEGNEANEGGEEGSAVPHSSRAGGVAAASGGGVRS
jgi:hypothetical protein